MLLPCRSGTTPAYTAQTLPSVNRVTMKPLNAQTISRLNGQNFSSGQTGSPARQTAPPSRPQQSTGTGRTVRPAPAPGQPAQPARPARPAQQPVRPRQPTPAPQTSVPPKSVPASARAIPPLRNPVQRGQKMPVWPGPSSTGRVRACVGWNVLDGRCDIDVSAFLVGYSGRVPDDRWFVFYGQDRSPDGSVHFRHDGTGRDREVVDIDLSRVSASVEKIVLVLTIHEALSLRLNFSMVRDAYIRLLDAGSEQEIFSYRLTESYPTVLSLTIGELYRYRGGWKFNPVGNGVHQDLAGQCAVYGVKVG